MYAKIILLSLYLTIQVISALIVIIYEKNTLKTMFFWLVFVIVIPLGIFVYIVFGNSLKIKTRKNLKKCYKSAKQNINQTSWIKKYKLKNHTSFNKKNRLLYCSNFDVWHIEKIDTFCFGKNFISQLLVDIQKATKYIFLEFYIFSDDIVGNKLKSALKIKAKQGLEIKILYDDFGSHETSDDFWNELKNLGVEIVSFFPSQYKFLNSKLNYRNHRKLVVIDGKIAYIGGINIRDDHMGKTSLYPWKDLMVKIYGGAVFAVLNVFLNDFFSQSKIKNITDSSKYFYYPVHIGSNHCQIVTSGPQEDKKYIYNCYLKAIKNAKKRIVIQTPYFILDKRLTKAIKRASLKGVKIDIILPALPDKNLIYGATLINIKKLIRYNINFYLFNGFVHSKLFLVDDNLSVGSCNFDNRSFKINFEVTMFLYGKKKLKPFYSIIDYDIKHAKVLLKDDLKKLMKKYRINVLLYLILKNLL